MPPCSIASSTRLVRRCRLPVDSLRLVEMRAERVRPGLFALLGVSSPPLARGTADEREREQRDDQEHPPWERASTRARRQGSGRPQMVAARKPEQPPATARGLELVQDGRGQRRGDRRGADGRTLLAAASGEGLAVLVQRAVGRVVASRNGVLVSRRGSRCSSAQERHNRQREGGYA